MKRVQLEQLNELLQRRVVKALDEQKLTKEDIQITVDGAKVEIVVAATKEILKI